MRIATITYHNVVNYGALLQAYALQQTLLKMSVDNVIIDYTPKQNLRMRIQRIRNLKSIVILMIRLFLILLHSHELQKQKKILNTFTRAKLILTKKYQSFESLKEAPPKADWYLAGSDQIWNITTTLHRAFFLDFGPPDIRRTSYAVSMGLTDVPEKYKKELHRLLLRFDSLSVREEETQKYINSLLSKENFVQLHCDPVYLLSRKEWLSFMKVRRIKGPYILCIPMGGHPLLNRALKRMKELTGYRTVIISTEVFTRVKGDLTLWDVCPQEFLYLIRKAAYVLTVSYHGTAFCTLFHKKFFSFTGNAAPGRITWLLKHLELEDRIITKVNDINLKTINYEACDSIIQKERLSALAYLNSLFHKD